MAEGKIVMLDDETEFLEAAGQFLRAVGYRVWVATTSQHALELIRQEQPHCFVMDLMLTAVDGLSGGALIEQVRQLSPQTRIVVITAYRDDIIKRRLIDQYGVAGYFYKPLSSLKDLEGTLKSLVTKGESAP